MLIKGELRYIQILKDRGTCIDSRLDEIKEQLIRGEKFEEMWEEITDMSSKFWQMWEELRENTKWMATTAEMDKVEEKYFPKPKEIDWEERFKELEEESKKREREFIRDIRYWKFRLAQSERRPIL